MKYLLVLAAFLVALASARAETPSRSDFRTIVAREGGPSRKDFLLVGHPAEPEPAPAPLPSPAPTPTYVRPPVYWHPPVYYPPQPPVYVPFGAAPAMGPPCIRTA